MRDRLVLISGILAAVSIIGALIYIKPWETSHISEVHQVVQAPASTTGAENPAEPQSASDLPQSNLNPDLEVDQAGLSHATVRIGTDKGEIKIKFYTKDAPRTVTRIVELIQKGFYNGLTFHRVQENFVVQGGDPKGDGTGGSGTRIPAEFNSRHHSEGAVGMARNSDPDSADSQFYICLAPQAHLDGAQTVFGQVIEGMEAVKKLARGDKMKYVVID